MTWIKSTKLRFLLKYLNAMLSLNEYQGLFETNPCDSGLLEIHQSTFSLHHAKEGYDYPMIRLPHTLSKLAGLPTRIYQTVHDGALAFLVVVGSRSATAEKSAEKSEDVKLRPKMPALTWRRLALPFLRIRQGT